MAKLARTEKQREGSNRVFGDSVRSVAACQTNLVHSLRIWFRLASRAWGHTEKHERRFLEEQTRKRKRNVNEIPSLMLSNAWLHFSRKAGSIVGGGSFDSWSISEKQPALDFIKVSETATIFQRADIDFFVVEIIPALPHCSCLS